ncbi:dynein regulatory complex subunit 3-like [Macrobrachium rosenbergii]|uniref:dynein regulatory complex subunit 3-like n=1 Tax=Macrobrachium rosenbergii TaxID=79674 RepID=UPI0034D5FD0B
MRSREWSDCFYGVSRVTGGLSLRKRAAPTEKPENVILEDIGTWQEVGTISVQMLAEALSAQHPHLPPLTHGNASNICAHVATLSLQFKGLGSLDFLWMFQSMTRLELSNNCLSVVGGLEKLVSLNWLDLSFNQLTSMDGLRELRNLEVLALHNNRLEKLDRLVLQSLPHLEVLTLANNLLDDIDDVRMLRLLGELSSLSLSSNPLCDERYPEYVLAHLPNLAYLDHRRLTAAEHSSALSAYKEKIDVVEAEEAKVHEQDRKDAEDKKSQEEHRKAGVLALNDGSLFTRMFRGDKDMGVLLQLPGAHALMTKYREQFNAVCLRVFNSGLAHQVERQEELDLLQKALNKAKNEADAYARGLVKTLETEAERILAAAHEVRAAEEASLGDDQEEHEARVAKTAQLQEEFESLIATTSHDLLMAEITLTDRVKRVVGVAREELGSLVGTFLEEAATDFQEARRLAYTFYCRLRELSSKNSDNGGNGNTEGNGEEMESRRAQVFEGSDTLTAALAGIHDRHLALIDTREDDLRQHLHNWLNDTLDQTTKDEWSRHRGRVEEITSLTARQRQAMLDTMPFLHD